MKKLKLSNIKITDALFGSYAKQVADKILLYQWNVLNDKQEGAFPTHCMENFRVASGEKEGERKGVVFQDTDLYKWLEAVAYCIANGSGKKYEELADGAIALIERAQEEDGYLNTYFTVTAPEKKWTNLVEGHELYTSGHLMEAAVAYYEATGKDRLLKIAEKNADLICRVFGRGEGQIKGYPGHQEVEIGLIKLYRATGKKKYLEEAYYFIQERGSEPNYLMEEIKRRGRFEFFPEFKNYTSSYAQAHIRPAKQKTAEGHAVRVMYMCAAMADLAGEYQDEELLEGCQALWENVTGKRMYITGGIGTSGFLERFTTDYDLPNTTNYSETCASIGLMMFGQRMTEVTGKAGYYDTVERALYNTVLAGINKEGDRYFYVNPLEVVPEFCTANTYMDHVKPVRQKWFDVACCPTNVARTLASLGQYIYAQDENTLYVHQFISSEAETEFAGESLKLKLESELLQTGRIHMEIGGKTGEGRELFLKIRLPGYAEKSETVINGRKTEPAKKNGYLVIPLAGVEKIDLDFGIRARWVAANPLVRADAGKVALMKGPCVYCLEEKENGKNLSAVYVKQGEEIREEAPAEELPGELPTLAYNAVRMINPGIAEGELYGEAAFEEEKVTLRAIPYALWNNRGQGEMLVWQKLKF